MDLKSNTFFDDLIGGSIQKDTITTIFGPPGCGKSTVCFLYIIECLKEGKKVIYVDTEGGFCPERIQQIDSQVDLKDIIVFSPKTFEEQQKTIKNLNKEIKNSKSIGLVIVDSLVMLYRLKVGGAPHKVNAELGEQLRLLTEVSRNFHIPILVTNQMYVNFDTKQNTMVGGTLLEYWSKTIVEIEKKQEIKKFILRKHKCKKSGDECVFSIVQNGISQSKNRSFSFFK